MAKKRRATPKDKNTGLPKKKYLTGLKGKKRKKRAKLIKKVSSLYKSGGFIPKNLLRSRSKA